MIHYNCWKIKCGTISSLSFTSERGEAIVVVVIVVAFLKSKFTIFMLQHKGKKKKKAALKDLKYINYT